MCTSQHLLQIMEVHDQTQQRRTHCMGVADRMVAYQQSVSNQPAAPKSFSQNWKTSRYQNLGHHQADENYGRPVAGSKTDLRGQQAGVHISSEIIELCNIIAMLGQQQFDGSVAVTFGELFEFYTRISNKVVGMLMRARRQGLVEFEGEMLFQRRDDHVVIRLVKSPDTLADDVEKRKLELRGHPARNSVK